MILSPENQAHLTHILANLDRVSDSLATQHQSIQASLEQLPMLLKDLRDTSQSTRQTMNDVSGQTLPALNETLFMMQSLMPNVSDFTQDLTNNPTMLIRGQGSPVLGPGEKP
jgi:ABC-type transporter Mla subunit MlaD